MAAYYYQGDFLDEHIGNGLSLTNTFNEVTLSTNVESGFEKIHHSIFTILSTRVGERIFLPEFGSRLHFLIFEQNNAVFADLADFYIRDALKKWEKRIDVTKVYINIIQKGNVVPIRIYYKIRNSNISGSYVYPFQKNSFGEPDLYEYGSMTPGTYK